MSANDLTQDQQDIIRKVEKLLNLSRKNSNEAEAAAAASKAQELLAAYNLDIALVEQGGETSGKREKAKLAGGTYEFQRHLWRAVAGLNYCMYFSRRTSHSRVVNRRDRWGGTWSETVRSWRRQHVLVGRTVNTVAARVMAEYLEQAIERLVMGRLHGNNSQRFSRWAVSYREGAVDRIIEKIRDRRDQVEEAEAARQREAQHRAQRAGASTSTALTMAAVRASEEEANQDFLYGEGWTQRQREAQQRRAEARRVAEEEYTRWAEANPEEARKKAAEEAAEEEKYWRRYRGGTREKQKDWGGYYDGYDAASDVSLEYQAGTKRAAGLIK